jgi:histidine phosphotransferase ChpT
MVRLPSISAPENSPMDVTVDLRVLELICSRICHDVVGPVGAINNGLELLAETGPADDDGIMPLLASSAKQAWRRLDYFRTAMGYAGGRSEWPVADLRRVAAGLFEEGKITFDWPAPAIMEPEPLPARQAKLLLHLVVLGAEALPRGGTLSLSLSDGPGTRRVEIGARGRSAVLHDRIASAVSGQVSIEELDPRAAQAFLAGIVARSLGVTVEMGTSGETVRLAAALPEA